MNIPSRLPPNLTAEQPDAILHSGGPLLIVARPGFGKTEATFAFATRLAPRRKAAKEKARPRNHAAPKLGVPGGLA